MTTRTPSRHLRASAATVATVAFLAAVVLVGPATPTARAGVSALAGPTLTVARGTTSAQSSGWRFSEISADEFPILGFSIIIEIRPYQGAVDGISFDQSSTPRFSGPGSLNGSAYFTGPRTLRIDIGTSAINQLESFEVVNLRLKASETCGLGPVVVSYTNPGFSGRFAQPVAVADRDDLAVTVTHDPADRRHDVLGAGRGRPARRVRDRLPDVRLGRSGCPRHRPRHRAPRRRRPDGLALPPLRLRRILALRAQRADGRVRVRVRGNAGHLAGRLDGLPAGPVPLVRAGDRRTDGRVERRRPRHREVRPDRRVPGRGTHHS
jgi:hypothetical protein